MASREPRTSKVDWKIIIPWALTMLGLALGFVQYLDKAAFEARKPFIERQTELVSKAVEAVAVLATSSDDKVWMPAKDTFYQLYWGQLSMVENANVASWMVVARRQLEAAVASGEPRPLKSLQNISLCLAHAGRDLVLDAWKVKLDTVSIELTGVENCAKLLAEASAPSTKEPPAPDIDPKGGADAAPDSKAEPDPKLSQDCAINPDPKLCPGP
jgi:hypothetical protein